MFAVSVTFAIEASQFDAFLALVTDNACKSLAVEPGCQRFDVCTDPDRPGEVLLYELYDDNAAFDAHLAAPHYAAFSQAVGAMVRCKDVRCYSEVR